MTYNNIISYPLSVDRRSANAKTELTATGGKRSCDIVLKSNENISNIRFSSPKLRDERLNSPASPGYAMSTRLDAVDRNVPQTHVEHGTTITGHNNPGSDCGTHLVIRSRSLVSSPESLTVRGVDSMPADGAEFAAV